MSRPGAVVEVDRNTPPTLFHFGEGFRLESLPLGARILYPPDPIDPIPHPERAIRRALTKPLDDDPLKGLLRPNMKLTIAFDDLSLPLPPMAAPDVRQLVIEEVTLSRRAAESDLVIYVNLTLVPMDGGHKSMATGLGSYRSVRPHHNVKTLLASRSYMHPPDSALHHSCIRQGQLIEDAVRVFHIETSVNNHAFPAIANFLQKRETDWTTSDQVQFLAMKQFTDYAPPSFKRTIFHSMRAPYGLTGVHAGQVDAVHDKTLEAVRRQMTVEVDG
ncbi:MAG: DUF2088 domain-containing protein, partial [Chloroflexi bacterium]